MTSSVDHEQYLQHVCGALLQVLGRDSHEVLAITRRIKDLEGSDKLVVHTMRVNELFCACKNMQNLFDIIEGRGNQKGFPWTTSMRADLLEEVKQISKALEHIDEEFSQDPGVSQLVLRARSLKEKLESSL